MKRAALLTVLALLLLLGTCVGQRSAPTSESLRVIIENQNWASATMRFFCEGTQIETARGIDMHGSQRVAIALRGCRSLSFTIDLLAVDSRYRSPPIQVRPGECWQITVGTRLAHTAWRPCYNA